MQAAELNKAKGESGQGKLSLQTRQRLGLELGSFLTLRFCLTKVKRLHEKQSMVCISVRQWDGGEEQGMERAGTKKEEEGLGQGQAEIAFLF